MQILTLIALLLLVAASIASFGSQQKPADNAPEYVLLPAEMNRVMLDVPFNGETMLGVPGRDKDVEDIPTALSLMPSAGRLTLTELFFGFSRTRCPGPDWLVEACGANTMANGFWVGKVEVRPALSPLPSEDDAPADGSMSETRRAIKTGYAVKFAVRVDGKPYVADCYGPSQSADGLIYVCFHNTGDGGLKWSTQFSVKADKTPAVKDAMLWVRTFVGHLESQP